MEDKVIPIPLFVLNIENSILVPLHGPTWLRGNRMAKPSLPLKEGGCAGPLFQASISRFPQLSCETEQAKAVWGQVTFPHNSHLVQPKH